MKFLRHLKALLVVLLTTFVVAQQAPLPITQRTPAPSRTGVQPLPTQKAQPSKAKTPPPQDEDEDEDAPAPKAKGGRYDLDLTTGEVTPSDEEEDVPEASGNRGGFGFSSEEDGSLSKGILQSSAYKQAKAAEAKRAEEAKNRPASPEVTALESVLAKQQAAEKELRALRRDSDAISRQTQQSILAGANRDAKTTNAAADVEFAEAAASRRASSIAREKGYSLIPAMRTIELRMLTFGDSEQPGKFKALVTNDVWDATFASVGIPRGTLARGFVEAAANDTDSRIRMTVTEFILPSGDSIQLRIPDAVTDELGAPGPKAKVDHHWGTRTFTGFATGFIGAIAAAGARSPSNSQATFSDVLQNNLAGQFGQAGQQSLQGGLQIKPTVQLKQGSIISMILGTNLYLIPWERLRVVIPAPNNTFAR